MSTIAIDFISLDQLASAALIVVRNVDARQREEIVSVLQDAATVAKATGRTISDTVKILFLNSCCLNGNIELLTTEERDKLIQELQKPRAGIS